MKCCYMQKKDLEKHFQQMTKCFYLIGGVDGPNFKQAVLSFIPEPLGEENLDSSRSTSGKNLSKYIERIIPTCIKWP